MLFGPVVAHVAPAFVRATDPTFATIASGTGISPNAGAVQNNSLFLVDSYGGASGAGAIYRLRSGALTLVYSFTGGNDGGDPNRRLQIDSKGVLYGTTQNGGANGNGTVFSVGQAGHLTTLHAFASADGTVPRDGLAVDQHGNFYATTSEGAVSPGNGTIFEQSGTAFAVTYYFQSMADGHCPFTGLQRDANGNMFGTTVGLGFGGQSNGSVWEYTAAGRLETLYSFTNGTDGEYPQITPTIDASDNIWGVSAIRNGSTFAGSVWSITSKGFAVRHTFSGGADGYAPNGPLLLTSRGTYYGTTSGGGAAQGSNGYGVVFSITPAGVFKVIHTFTNGSDGAHPTGGLVQAKSGVVYGGTSSGTVFTITP